MTNKYKIQLITPNNASKETGTKPNTILNTKTLIAFNCFKGKKKGSTYL